MRHSIRSLSVRAARLSAPSLVVVTLASGILAQQIEGPPPVKSAQPTTPLPAVPTVKGSEQGALSLKIPANRDLTSTGMYVRKGEVVRVRAWGRVRIGRAGNAAVYPEGLNIADPYKIVSNFATCGLLAVVGEDNTDYVFVGREAEFRAAHDGILFLALNQGDVSGNSGEFDARVTVGEQRGLAFGVGQDILARPTHGVAVTQPEDAGQDAKRVLVSSRLDWTTTSITVHKGDVISVEAGGAIVLNLGGTAVGPDGASIPDPQKLIPEKPTGALIAVVGVDNNDFLYVGAKGSFTAARDGLLFLGVNENDLTNNSGEFSALVRISRAKK
jgi:hypothetical protein